MNSSLKVFFSYLIVSSIVTILSTHFEKKTGIEIIKDFYLRYFFGIVIGINTGLGVMFGQDLYIYFKKLKK